MRKQMRQTMLVVTGVLVAVSASANERRFTYTYESATLGAGQMEIEPWTTVRYGRDDFYLRFDNRLELEVGITDHLQMAWYIKTKAVNQAVDQDRAHGFDFSGVSWEWKYQLLDPVADPVGLALYFEPGLGPTEGEIEAKIIIDKRMGNFLMALNLVGEYEVEFEHPELEHEGVLEVDIGLAYFLTPRLSLGVEIRSHNEIVPDEGLEHAVLFAGPVVAYSSERWWLAFTLPFQVAALKGANSGHLDLAAYERMEARLLLGFHL